jgi:hypothetical protein
MPPDPESLLAAVSVVSRTDAPTTLTLTRTNKKPEQQAANALPARLHALFSYPQKAICINLSQLI